MFKGDEKGYTKRYRVNKRQELESSEAYDLDKEVLKKMNVDTKDNI